MKLLLWLGTRCALVLLWWGAALAGALLLQTVALATRGPGRRRSNAPPAT